ncbi:hypothetical protein [Echinimonas agarilytica]|uniref:Uncharacterized protein n=1 Tax=Echinimonas agarilytica TaxID=1215918 RepID=A0AA42B651_9GAMM|nr:hypothetical protein [Echinimonas agarilytica]MCM2678382.1 hypothetical protein [Echinimonas agarilytica]
MEFAFTLLLLCPMIASATMQQGLPFRSFAIHFPLSLVAGFALAYPASIWLGPKAVAVGYIGYYITFYVLDKPIREFVRKYWPKKK